MKSLFLVYCQKMVNKIRRATEILLVDIMAPILSILPLKLRIFLKFLTERYYTGIIRARYFWDVLTLQKASGIEFSLWIKGGHNNAQKEYVKLQNTKEAYEPLMVECLKNIFFEYEVPVFIDIGAFMGYYACFACSFLKDKYPVYAIESNPQYCKVIEKSFSENNFNNAKIFNGVLSDKEEILSINKETVSKDTKGQQIQSVTLDELCRREDIKPNILKIDVHGAEGKVIGGAKKVLRDYADFVLFEIHPDDYLKKYSPGYTRESILSVLEESGFCNYLVGGFRYQRSPEREVFKNTGQIRCIRITPENREVLFFDRHSDLFILATKKNNLDFLDILKGVENE